jgi:HD-like signal output (HDOD) protein
MRNWLSWLFGRRRPDDAPVRAHHPPTPRQPRPRPVSAGEPAPSADGPLVAPSTRAFVQEHANFLAALVDPPPIESVEPLPTDDRAFVAGVLKRWRKRELELPVMPAAAIRLAALLREGGQTADYVALLEGDPALSMDVLKVASSAFYASAMPITSLQEAVIRIGHTRLQAILMTSHLKARVLKGGAFRREAEILLDLALPMGFLASRLARDRESTQDICFMRGVLMHVEHLVILSSVQEVSRDLRRTIVPSPKALHQAIVRFAPEIRAAIATLWSLEDLLIGGADEARLTAEYADLRRALVYKWLGRPLPAIDGVDPAQLADALDDLHAPGAKGSSPASSPAERLSA